MEELSKINRRRFIKTGAKLGAWALLNQLPIDLLANQQQLVKVTILHTNDWHSRIESFPKDGSKYAGMGGAATRAALIKKIRTEDKQVLLLDAGDMFQGTPYFNFFDGELEYRLMSQMGYDAVTLGNHDFDKGIDGIIKQLPFASFDIINCNYDCSATPLKDKVKPYRIFNKGGVNIGVIGVGIDLIGLVPNDLFAGIKYNDPISIATNLANDLKKNKNCDYVICLSHLGYEYSSDKISDRIFASKSTNIDLIIGGHTHTFLPKPIILKNADNKEVIINQVGWAGLQLGKIELYFDSAKNLVNKGVAQNLYIKANAC
jgi:5'-nucleotidase